MPGEEVSSLSLMMGKQLNGQSTSSGGNTEFINSVTAFEVNVDQETLLTTERVSWEWRDKVVPSSLGKHTAMLSIEVPPHQRDKKSEAPKGSGPLGRPGRLASPGS